MVSGAAFLSVPCRGVSDETGFEFGFQHRVRYVDYDNIIDYSDAADDENRFFRFRTQVWGRLIPVRNVEFRVQLTNEFRHYFKPERDHSFDEIVFDQCYVELKNLFDSGWSVKAGRQNIMKGEGFILFDGGPLDGSRTAYFNSINVTKRFTRSAIEVFAISNPAQDRYFPRIGDQSRSLIETDEEALGTCFTSGAGDRAEFDVYYLFKREISPAAKDSPLLCPKRSLHIAGLRSAVKLGSKSRVTGEMAGESGEQCCGRNIRAWAAYVSYEHTVFPAAGGYIKMTAAGLSGDDPATLTDGAWDPPFSRWPKWSELYIYSFIRERGVAYWSNLYFSSAEFAASPFKPWRIRAGWYHMGAFYDVFSCGSIRGNLFQLRNDFNIAVGLTGHVLYEYFLPGDFYAKSDPGHFLRFELTYQFSHGFQF
ncbi:hypothetical protein JXA40_03760 [bacterium]|nr:hypothetical protein [candidate division CSSED10-310 bacterium]